MRRGSQISSWTRSATWIVCGAMLLGQLAVGFGLSPNTATGDACCGEQPSSDAGAQLLDVALDQRGHGEGPCSDDGCGPGCEECSCCPSAVAAVYPSLARGLNPNSGTVVAISPSGRPASGVSAQVFRPPKPTLA